MSLIEETKELLKCFKDEDIKFLHLVDRVGYDNIINQIEDIDLIKDIKSAISIDSDFLISEDNLNIVSHLAQLENPYIKEDTFRLFYKKNISNQLPLASIDNIIKKDMDSIYSEVNKGLYRNPFTDLMVEIVGSNTGSFAAIEKLTDRNFNSQHSVMIDLDEVMLSNFYKDGKNINTEFILNHELAHVTGVQLFNPSVDYIEDIGLIKENHSDTASLIKIIKDHNLNYDESIELVNDLLLGRSNFRKMGLDLFTNDNYLASHLTHPSLILLKGFLSNDFDYIQSLETKDISVFSMILAESACNKSCIKAISNNEDIINSDTAALADGFIQLRNMDGNNSFKRIMNSACEILDCKEPEFEIALKLNKNIYAKFEYEMMLLAATDKKSLFKIKFPFESQIIESIKMDLEDYKEDLTINEIKLTEFFDYNEVVKKTNNLKMKEF